MTGGAIVAVGFWVGVGAWLLVELLLEVRERMRRLGGWGR